QHWFIGLALPAPLPGVLKQLSALIIPDEPQYFSSERGQLLQRQLLRAWPGSCRDARLQIALAPDVPDAAMLVQEACPPAAQPRSTAWAAGPSMVPLPAVPALLSSSFATL